MSCEDCQICKYENVNQQGLEFCEKEVLPYLKKTLLKLHYADHPLPMRFREEHLMQSCFTYAQVYMYCLSHGIMKSEFYTDSETLLKFSNEFFIKFGIVKILDSKLANENMPKACEYNVEPQ